MKWLETAEFPEAMRFIGCNPVYEVNSPEDIRLAFYRLAKCRNATVYSWFNKLMIDSRRNLLLVISKTVVHRMLRGIHEIVSVAGTEEMIDELSPLLDKRRLIEGVYVLPHELFRPLVGIDINAAQTCCALVDFQPAACNPMLPSPDSWLASQRPYLWETHTQWGMDRRSDEADNICAPMLILDDVRNSDNIGVIMRTAFSLGIRSLMCTRTSYAAIGCRAARTSLGALAFLAVGVTENIVQCIEELKSGGLRVIGTSPRGTTCIRGKPGDNQWALVLGNEEVGSSDEVMRACSELVSIPQIAGDSLSVSVAAGICMYELLRHQLQEHVEPGGIGYGDC